MLWNGAARQTLGHSASRVVGLKRYKVMAALADPGLTADYGIGCACIRYARVGIVPAPLDLMTRCASGVPKLLQVQPLMVSGVGGSGPMVVYRLATLKSNSRPRAVCYSISPDLERVGVDVVGVRGAARLGAGMGRRGHCGRTGRQPAHGSHPCNELASQAGPLVQLAMPSWSPCGRASSLRSDRQDVMLFVGQRMAS